jgi:stringent starvation protein B
MATRVPAKKETLLAFLSRGVAMVHVDARKPGVVVPRQHQGDPHLRLNLSYRYGIPDLQVHEDGVQATLSFGGYGFRCILPWEAVFAVTSQGTGDGQVWPEDLPTELAGMHKAPERPTLAAVQSEATPEPEPRQPQDGAPRRHLRLVR